jgi:hypothetical protein
MCQAPCRAGNREGLLPARAGEADDLVEFGLGVAVAAEGEGAGEVRPVRRVQPVEVAGDEDFQRGRVPSRRRAFWKASPRPTWRLDFK